MDVREVQTRLKAMQLYGGAIDGKYGPLSKTAIEALFAHQQIAGFGGWNRGRRIVAAGQLLCRIDGIETGKTDGLIGPQTRHAFEVYDARKRDDKGAETWRDADQDKPPLFAPPAATTWPRQSDCSKFYGPIGSNQVSITVPYPLKLAWDTSKTLKKITCHKKVAEPTRQVLERVFAHYGLDEIRRLRLDLFGGSLNVRKMRGGSSWSMHAWGIAFDFDPERNQLNWHKPKAAFSASEYKPWFNAWSAEGAIGLGPARDYDWMHTQFARL